MLKFLVIAVVGMGLLFCPVWAKGQAPDGPRSEFSVGLSLGYHYGVSGQIHGMVRGFAEDFPLSARLAIGYSKAGPGSALDSRRIFINDATNGFPEKSGRVWEFRGDLLYPVRLLNLERAYIFGGPRYAMFTGNFKFVGGNEDFDVRSDQWGLGTGLQGFFRMNPRVDLVLTLGIDYFFESTLTGHDTSYSPDGEDVNPRDDYTFDDADAAVNQPELEFQAMFGFSYSL
ncbi:MAG: hypothetical protein RBT76_06920 [candidate division Zixibacteria bacterium]|jgi:hypothetical protein|nr:hypothetical protein [candidate division Zixibacteria bacterium]